MDTLIPLKLMEIFVKKLFIKKNRSENCGGDFILP